MAKQTFIGQRSGATYRVTTNNHRREIIDGWELTPAERETFDYIDWAAVERGEDSASFVRYRGDLIDLGDVMVAGEDMSAAGWHGFNADTYFSGLAFRYVNDIGETTDYVVVARVMIED